MRARPLSPHEIARVRAYFERYPYRYRERDRCIFELGINCGLRVSELCALKVGQVWQYGEVVRRLEITETKGGKHRAIPLNGTARRAVRELIAWKAGRERMHPDDPLFRSRKGGHLRRWQVDWLWKRIKRDCRISGKVTTHSWRKTFATGMHDLGVPLRVIQQLLGHSSLATTEAYLGVTATQEERAVSKLDEYHEIDLLCDSHPASNGKKPQEIGASVTNA